MKKADFKGLMLAVNNAHDLPYSEHPYTFAFQNVESTERVFGNIAQVNLGENGAAHLATYKDNGEVEFVPYHENATGIRFILNDVVQVYTSKENGLREMKRVDKEELFV